MSNLYIGMYRDALKQYFKKHQSLNKELARINATYQPEYAEPYLAEVKQKQMNALREAQDTINGIFTDVRSMLASANFINVEELTADRLLFTENTGFDLSLADVQAYAERYKENYTMSRLIRDWIGKHNETSQGAPFGKFNDVKITMPEDQVSVYKQFGDSALNIVDRIFSNEATEFEVNNFADENMCGDLMGVIGSGMKLTHNAHRIPESVQHCFDNINLNVKQTNGNVYEGS